MFTFYLFNSVVSFKGEKLKIKEKSEKKISYVNKSGLSDDCDVLIKETDNATLLELDSDGTGYGLYIHKDGSLAAGKHALKVYSDISQGNEPLVFIHLDNTGCTKEALVVRQDGITANSKIQSWYAGAVEMGYIDIEGDMHVEGSFGSFLDIISSTASKVASSVQSSVTQAVDKAVSVVKSTASQTNSPTMEVKSENSLTTTPALKVINESTQSNTDIVTFESDGIKAAIDTLGKVSSEFIKVATSITSEDIAEILADGILEAGKNALRIYSDLAQTDANALVNYILDNENSTIPILDLENYGSGETIKIYNYGGGTAIWVNQLGTSAEGDPSLHIHTPSPQPNAPLVCFENRYIGGMPTNEVLRLNSYSSEPERKILTFYEGLEELGYIDKQYGGAIHDLRYRLEDPDGSDHGVCITQTTAHLVSGKHALYVRGTGQEITSALVKFTLEDVGTSPISHLLELYGDTYGSVLDIHNAGHGGYGIKVVNDVTDGTGVLIEQNGSLVSNCHALHVKTDSNQNDSPLVYFNSGHVESWNAALSVTNASTNEGVYAVMIGASGGALQIITADSGFMNHPIVDIQNHPSTWGDATLLRVKAHSLWEGKCVEIQQGALADTKTGLHVYGIGVYAEGHNALKVEGNNAQPDSPLVYIKQTGYCTAEVVETLRVHRDVSEFGNLKIQTWNTDEGEVAYLDTKGNFKSKGIILGSSTVEIKDGESVDEHGIKANITADLNAGKHGLLVYTNIDQTNSPLAMFHHDAACEQGIEVVRVRQDDTSENAKVQSWYAGLTERAYIDIDGDMYIDGDFGCDSSKTMGHIIHDDAADWDGSFNAMSDVNDKLEVIDIITEEQTTYPSGFNAACSQEIYLEEGEVITKMV